MGAYISFDEKHILFYSPKYAQKAKADREAVLSKAQKLIYSPSAYARAASYGAAKYVTDLTYSPSLGEVIDDAEHLLISDEDGICQDRFRRFLKRFRQAA